MLCTERHLRKGTELVQVGFDPAALFDACEINREIYLNKYDIKRSRKSYSTKICQSSPYIYFHVKVDICKCFFFFGLTRYILRTSPKWVKVSLDLISCSRSLKKKK